MDNSSMQSESGKVGLFVKSNESVEVESDKVGLFVKSNESVEVESDKVVKVESSLLGDPLFGSWHYTEFYDELPILGRETESVDNSSVKSILNAAPLSINACTVTDENLKEYEHEFTQMTPVSYDSFSLVLPETSDGLSILGRETKGINKPEISCAQGLDDNAADRSCATETTQDKNRIEIRCDSSECYFEGSSCATNRFNRKAHGNVLIKNKKKYNRNVYDKSYDYKNRNPNKCNFCEQAFSSKRNLYLHARIRTSKNPFLCAHYPQFFSNLLNRNADTTVSVFKCDGCGRTFTNKMSFEMHENNTYHPKDDG